MSQGLPLKDNCCVRAKTRTEETKPHALAQGQRLIMSCSPLCSVCACCDLSIVLAQTASRVDSEPMINKYRLKRLSWRGLSRLHIKTALLTGKDKCLCLSRRTQYMFAPCSWGLERSANSTRRNHAYCCVAAHAAVGPRMTQQLRCHGP